MLFAIVVGVPGCVTPSASPTSAPVLSADLGEAKSTAIEVCKPFGERFYLDHLRCVDGSPPTYHRVGSFGPRVAIPDNLTNEQKTALLKRIISGEPLAPGEPDHHIIDGYEVSCVDSKRMIYMDMYHCHQPLPATAPNGFRLAPT
jgi:hypothetical protein